MSHSKGTVASYVPLQLDDSEHQNGNCLGEHGSDLISVFVLHKEKRIPVKVPPDCSISVLKSGVALQTNVTPNEQRLLYAGKLLTPDSSTLGAFKLVDGSSVHLFPKAKEPPPAPTNSSRNPLHISEPELASAANASNQGSTPIRFALAEAPQLERDIDTLVREVRFWSFILLMLSSLTVLNTFSLFLDKGYIGQGGFDTVVSFMDLCVSLGGCVVGRMGLNSTSVMPLNVSQLKNYSRTLGYLAVAAVVYRIAWVFDIIFQVQKDVKESQEEAAAAAANGSGGSGTDTGTDTSAEPPLQDEVVFTVGVQAALIGIIIASMWLSCFMRSLRLQAAVASANANAGVVAVPPVAAEV